MRGLLLDLLIMGGLVTQGVGLYILAGPAWSAIGLGSELLVIGLVGAVLNAVR